MHTHTVPSPAAVAVAAVTGADEKSRSASRLSSHSKPQKRGERERGEEGGKLKLW